MKGRKVRQGGRGAFEVLVGICLAYKDPTGWRLCCISMSLTCCSLAVTGDVFSFTSCTDMFAGCHQVLARHVGGCGLSYSVY